MGGCHLPRAATAPRWHGDAQGAGRKAGWGGLRSPHPGPENGRGGENWGWGLTLRAPDSSLFSLHPCLMMPPCLVLALPPKPSGQQQLGGLQMAAPEVPLALQLALGLKLSFI